MPERVYLLLFSIILTVCLDDGSCQGDETGDERRIIVSESAVVRASSVWVNGSEGSNLYSIIDGSTTGQFLSDCAMTYYEIEDAYFEIDMLRTMQISQIDIYSLNLTEQNGAGNLQGVQIWLKKMDAGSMGPADLTVEQETIFMSLNLEADAAAQYVVIYKTTTVRFALCEVIIWSTDILSFGATVTMAPSHDGPLTNPSISQRAIDENGSSVVTEAGCLCCATTGDQTLDPWLQVDLGKEYRVSAVAIYSRTDSEQDTLGNLHIYLTSYTDDMGSAYMVVSEDVTFVHVSLQPDHVTRFVTLIRKVTDMPLSICEIRVFGRVCGNNTYGEECKVPCGHCAGADSCDIIDGHCDACQNGYFDDTCVYELVSDGKTMLSSSVYAYPNPEDLWMPSRAVDGDNRTSPMMCECCAGTLASDDPWMTLDLHGDFRIYQILVVGQGNDAEAFEGLEIYLSDTSTGNGSIVYTVNNATEDNDVTDILVTFTPDVGGRYVILRLRGQSRSLVVCELEVRGVVCPAYRYGPVCSEECGHCMYGDSCSSIDGKCSDCAPGYTGPTCKQECYPGTFGSGCARTCGACYGYMPCDHVNGSCDTCQFDFYGQQCKYQLVSEAMPVNISSTQFEPSVHYWDASKAVDGDSRTDPNACQCCAGTLEELSPWLQVNLDLAYRVARISVFGRTDDQDNTLQHLRIYTKAFSNGMTSPVYVEEENVTYIEVTLQSVIPTDVVTLVLGPERGTSSLYLCEVKVFAEDCDLGLFGTHCESMCRCYENKPCSGLTGQCPDGLCAAGWLGDSCGEECRDGLYGMNCSSSCGFCNGGLPCEKPTGYCLDGCDILYTGLWCKELLPAMTTTGTIIGIILGGLAFLFTGIAIGVRRVIVFYRKRRLWGYQPPFEGFPDDWTAVEVQIKRKEAELGQSKEQKSEESSATELEDVHLPAVGIKYEVIKDPSKGRRRMKRRRLKRKRHDRENNGEHKRDSKLDLKRKTDETTDEKQKHKHRRERSSGADMVAGNNHRHTTRDKDDKERKGERHSRRKRRKRHDSEHAQERKLKSKKRRKNDRKEMP